MVPVLEIRREGQRVRVAFYATGAHAAGAFVPDPVRDFSPLSRREIWAVCREAERILESTNARCTDEEHDSALRGLAGKVAEILPANIRHLLAARAAEGGPLSIRFHGRLFSLPLELVALEGGHLLGGVFAVGVQVIGGSRTPKNPRLLRPGQPVRVLIVANTSLPYARNEVERLQAALTRHGADKVRVIVLRNPSRKQLESALEHCDVLHVAGHATCDDSIKQSGWVLGRSDLWRVMDAAACRATRWPVFVFANLCAKHFLTGRLGRLVWRAMAREFVQHGVTHYLGAYARIPDGDHVIEFALAFYEALFKGGHSVGAAVRLARKAISDDALGRLIASLYSLAGEPGAGLGSRVPSTGLIHSFPAIPKPLVLMESASGTIQTTSTVQAASPGVVQIVGGAGFGQPIHLEQETLIQMIQTALQQDRREAGREHFFTKLSEACVNSGNVFDQVAVGVMQVLEKSRVQPEALLKSLPLPVEHLKKMEARFQTLWAWAELAFAEQRYLPASVLYVEALEPARLLNELSRQADCFLRLCGILRELRPGEVPPMAPACLEFAKNFYATDRNRLGIAFAEFREAEMRQDLKDWLAARTKFGAVLPVFQSARQLLYVGYTQYRLAQVARDSGDHGSQWDHVSDAQEAWLACGRPDLVDRHIRGEFSSED